MQRTLLVAGAATFTALMWLGGAFEFAPYLGAEKGTKAAFMAKLLIWDHNALTKIVLNPFLARPVLFFVVASALALAPLAYGASRGLWRNNHSLAVWAMAVTFGLGIAFLLPLAVLPKSLSPFAEAWWRTTALLGTALGLFGAGLLNVRKASIRTRDILNEPHAYDLMDLSGAAGLAELKRAGLLVRSSEWPHATSPGLTGRLCIGRLYDEGRPTGFFVAPEITKLQQTLVVAPTGSGKTTSLALPWSRELPRKGQSVFVLDFKGDMAGQIRHPASRPGDPPVWVFDPLGEESVRWNPMREPVPGSADFAESQDAIAEAIFGEVNGGAYQYFDLLDLRILKAGVRAVGNLEAPSLKALHDLFLSEQHRLSEDGRSWVKIGP